MSVQDQIDRIAGAKATLGAYLAQNGVPVPTGATLDKMALQLADVIEKQNKITAVGILKGDGAGGVTAATPGTDYLAEAPVTSVNGATGKVKSTFYVAVTQGNGDHATADKTAEEVYAAYEAGYAVYAIAKFRGGILPYTLPLLAAASVSGSVVLAFATTASNNTTTNPQCMVLLYNGSAWSAFVITLAKASDIPTIPTELKNPNALNIKIGNVTTSYDGSAAKTVEIPKGVPAVTAADNGKILRVVNGAWAATELLSAGGASF